MNICYLSGAGNWQNFLNMLADTFNLPNAEFDYHPDVLGFPLSPEFIAEREEVTRIYENTRRLCAAGYSDETVNAAVKKLGEVPGINMLSAPDFRGEENFRCAEWVFGSIQKEIWAMRGFTVDTAPLLWTNPVSFLRYSGYEFTDSPRPGCIVAYGDTFPDGRIWLEHFGIYLGATSQRNLEHVVSKFGQGPLIEHRQSIISNVWGSKYFYLEKLKTHA